MRIPSGDDRSLLNSRVFPSLRFSSSTSFTTPHFTRKHSAQQDFRVSASGLLSSMDLGASLKSVEKKNEQPALIYVQSYERAQLPRETGIPP
ncbi:hypothetical protein SBA3_80007 [Candidatus Sulfopaludibacter sp. SbA3]|nr:hypothetical protein SBA3_80007 [Candidatus Sulfopaludibacter sp. SbA3]